MFRSCTPVSDWLLHPYRPYFPTACFVAGCLEREQWLNVACLQADWLRACAAWLGRSAPPPSVNGGTTADKWADRRTPQ